MRRIQPSRRAKSPARQPRQRSPGTQGGGMFSSDDEVDEVRLCFCHVNTLCNGQIEGGRMCSCLDCGQQGGYGTHRGLLGLVWWLILCIIISSAVYNNHICLQRTYQNKHSHFGRHTPPGDLAACTQLCACAPPHPFSSSPQV